MVGGGQGRGERRKSGPNNTPTDRPMERSDSIYAGDGPRKCGSSSIPRRKWKHVGIGSLVASGIFRSEKSY